MRKVLISFVMIALATSGAWAATLNVDADNGPYYTIEDAVDIAVTGDVIMVADGIYDPEGTLIVDVGLTLTGNSEAGVIINIPADGGYGIIVTASDVLLENFTLVTNAANENFPIHASGTSNVANGGFDNLILQNITINGVHRRTGFDVNGYNHVTMSNLTSRDAYGGNGAQISGCVDVDVDNIVTSDNAWGSFAIYVSKPGQMNRGSDDVFIDGASCSFGEGNLFNQDEAGLFNTNIIVTDYYYFVRNFNFRPDAAGYTFFQDTEANAVANALALDGIAPGSFIIQISTGDFVVASGMAIQPAIDAASPGDTVDVGAGTYQEQLSINKDLALTGAGAAMTTVEAPDPVDRTTFTIQTWTGSTKTIDAVIAATGSTVDITGFKVDGRDTGPSNFYGIYFYDCNGSVTYCEVDGITYPAQPGAQAVLSMVFTHGTGAGPYTVDASNNVIPAFQKGGIYVGGPDMVFTVNGNNVSSNPSANIAGNGIQLGYGATGTTNGNTVTGVGYSGDDWAGTGILLFESGDVAMTGDTVIGSQSGVNYSDWRWVHSHPVPVNLTFNDLVLTDNEWSFSAQLSGDQADLNVIMNGCEVTGSTGDGVDFYGTDIDPWGGTYYTGWDNGDLNVTIEDLSVDNTAIDGMWTADNSGNLTNTVHSFTVHNSSFTNTTGDAIANNFTTTIDAAECYWGDPAGPTGGAKAGGYRDSAPMISPAGFDLPEKGGVVEVPGSGGDKAASTISGPVAVSPWYGFPIGTSPMTWGVNPTGTINDAVIIANSGDTINVTAGTFIEPVQVFVDKDVSIIGAGATQTIVNPGFNTGTGAYNPSGGFFYVDYGVTALIQDLAIDGTGWTCNTGIQSRGDYLEVIGCAFSNISSAIYDGRGIVFLTGTGLVQDVIMSDCKRIGVHIRGGAIPPSPSPVVTVDGLTYTGKGVGDFLDYGVEFGGGGMGTVTNSTITACEGVASDGSTSGGILVTDYYGTGTTADITNTTLTGNTTGLVVGYNATDISQATISGSDISGNTSYGVTSTGVEVDALNNWWGTPLGPFHPTLNPGGTGNEVSDNVLFEPWVGIATIAIAPVTTGPTRCEQVIPLTVSYTSDASTPDLFLYNMVVSVGPELAFQETLTGGFVSEDPFGGSAASENFLVYPNGDGTWTVTGSTVANSGQEIPPSTTEELFTMNLSTITDGLGAVTISDVTLRDPSNATFFATVGGATIEVDCTSPVAVTGITADPRHNRVDVSWSHSAPGDVDHYEVWRGMWYDTTVGNSAYPEYDDQAGDIIPTRPTVYGDLPDVDGEWVQVDGGIVTTLAFTDDWTSAPDRGVFYYEVFAVDAAGNGSPVALTNDRATNYWLGDVYGGSAVDPVPNGFVDVWDINELGANFGDPVPHDDPINILDVGPTDDWSRVGIPLTDSMINFEDLMVFSMNFGIVSDTKAPTPISSVIDLAWVRYDDGRQALRLVDGNGMKGLNIRANVQVSGLVAGELLDDQSELTFLKNVGEKLDVSVAVMGTNTGFAGTGDLFIVDAESAIDIKDLTIKVRGHDNSELQFKMGEATGSLMPRAFALNPNYPNPFNPMTKISFSLPESQDVRLEIYGVDGRKVATLLNETRGPGLHEVIWNGQDDSGRQASSGMYFYRISAGPYSAVHKMTLMK